MMIDTLFNKANKLFSSHKYFEALKIYEKIWIKFPKNIRLHTEINKKIKKYKKLDNSWKLIKVRNNLEFGNPFTLSNYIFIPEYIIFSNNIEDTLLHEYIHINQRNNQKRYNDLYPKNLDWYLLDYNIDDSKINNKIVNPDGTNNNWYFNYKNNKIIPFLIFSNGNYIPKYYIIDNSELIEYKNHNEISNYLKKKYKINNNIYHPNEIIATILSDKIINNKKIDKKLIHFIN